MRWLYCGIVAAGLLLVGGGWLTSRVMTPSYDEANIGAGLMVLVGWVLVLFGVLAVVFTRLGRAVRERRYERRATNGRDQVQ